MAGMGTQLSRSAREEREEWTDTVAGRVVFTMGILVFDPLTILPSSAEVTRW